MDERALIQERVALWEKSKALLDGAKRGGTGTLSPTDQATFDNYQRRIDEIKRTLDAGALVDAEERALSESRGRKTQSAVDGGLVDPSDAQRRNLALRAWALGARARKEMVEAAESLGFNHYVPELETRMLSSVTATQGQASIGNEMIRSFIEAQKWTGRVRNLATVWTTTTGAPLPIPTVDDTSNSGEIVADGGAVTTTADPTFGQVLLHPFKYSSKAVIVPVELVQDSAIDMAGYLGAACGVRIGRKQNADFTAGAGTTLPFGVQVQASLGKTASATNAITFDEVIDLYHSVDVAYRDRPGTAFMMADAVAAYLRKVKDSQNRYLWEMSLIAGQPDRIFGKPVVINNDQDSAFSTNKRLVLFGDFGAYQIQDAGPPVFIRADELRVLNHQVVFLAFQRSDGNLGDTTAVKYLRTA